jgi:hypothetical protein
MSVKSKSQRATTPASQSRSAVHDTAADVVGQRRREFVGMDALMVLRALVTDTDALIEFREKGALYDT